MTDDQYWIMHTDMLNAFTKWRDELTLRHHGWRYSDLQRVESAICRLACAESQSLTPGAREELERLMKEYREVWKPRILKMVEGK